MFSRAYVLLNGHDKFKNLFLGNKKKDFKKALTTKLRRVECASRLRQRLQANKLNECDLAWLSPRDNVL